MKTDELEGEMKSDQNEFYVKTLDESAGVRSEVDNKWRDLKRIGLMFEKIYGLEPKEFMLLHNGNYYNDDGEGEDGMKYARLLKMVKTFAKTVHLLRQFKEDETLQRFLDKEGITVSETSPGKVESDLSALITHSVILQGILGTDNVEEDPEKLAQTLLDKACDIQREICSLADDIKIHAAGEVKEKCNIEKPHFINAVKMRAEEKKAINIGKKLDKTKHQAVSITMSISPFEEK